MEKFSCVNAMDWTVKWDKFRLIGGDKTMLFEMYIDEFILILYLKRLIGVALLFIK